MPDAGSAYGSGADLGRLPGLSIRAVEAVAALGLTDPDQLAHGCTASTGSRCRRRPSRRLPDGAGLVAAAAVSGWQQRMSVQQAAGWLLLQRDDDRAELSSDSFGYKLYLSPRPEAVADVIPVAAAAAARVGVSRFKIGADAVGLLRPDKIVFYAVSAGELGALADALVDVLVDIPAHGVPFTAPLTDDGLLSWAGDPTATNGRERESWRMFVCRRLGELLAQDPDPSAALTALAADGVLVPSFRPAQLAPPEPDARRAA